MANAIAAQDLLVRHSSRSPAKVNATNADEPAAARGREPHVEGAWTTTAGGLPFEPTGEADAIGISPLSFGAP
jgi:hypothetical protein